MTWLPTSQASAALYLHRNTLHKYRREGLFKAGTHWVRKGPWRNAGYLYDVDACKETFQQWAEMSLLERMSASPVSEVAAAQAREQWGVSGN